MIIDVHSHAWNFPGDFSADFIHQAGRARPGVAVDMSATYDAYRASAPENTTTIVFGGKARLSGLWVDDKTVAEYVAKDAQRLIGFLSVDPTQEGWEREMHVGHEELCLRGIKLLPMYAGFSPDDPKLEPLWQYAEKYGLPVLLHMGTTFIAQAPLAFTLPRLIEPVALKHPGVKIILAHLGHPYEGECLVTIRKHENVFADVSALHYRPWQLYNSLMLAQEYGVWHKLLFGTDFPFTTVDASIDGIRKLNDMLDGTKLPRLDVTQIEAMIHRDSLKLLGLEEVMQKSCNLSVLPKFTPDFMDPSPTSIRRHDLDALRAFAMLLGIALHAALSFAGGPWMVQDSRTSGVFHLLIGAVHGFRMPLFFLLSGFFTAMLWRRRRLRAVVAHRFRRVFLPLMLGSVTIIPLMHVVGGWAAKSGARNRNSQAAVLDLWKASTMGDLARVTKLIDAGADINAPDPGFGVTPLSLAATFGHYAVVKLLLKRGADVKRTNRDGGTALHGAAFFGRSVIAGLLLEAGIDPAVKNGRGDTALDATLADWGTTQFIAGLIQVTVERNPVLEGRKKIRQLLGAADLEPKPRPLLGLWLFLTFFPLFHHLWFLWFLCWMVAGFAVCAWIANRIGWQPRPRRWVNSPLRYLWLVPLTMIPAWFMGRDMPNFGPDTSSAILPPLRLLAYYAIFFGFGALYFDSQDERGSMGSRWWLTMPLALFVVYPAGLHANYGGAKLRGVAILLQVIYVWAMSAAMMGLFRRFVSKERGWIRYLSDASYWMYVAHLPLVIVAQLWVRDWAMAPGWKFLIDCGGVFAVLLVSYEYLVRYTWIGTLINGRKQRAGSPIQT